MFQNILVLITALFISLVAAFYSIYGLTTLFASAFWPVVIMGSALEIGKLVTAAWLHQHWTTLPKYIRGYLVGAVAILMFITSVGIFGFLSRAHIDQQMTITDTSSVSVGLLDNKIKNRKDALADYDKQIKQIDDAISTLNTKGRSNESLTALEKQKKNRQGLVKEKETISDDILKLENDKLRANSTVRKLEAEIGPIKYIADLVYGGKATNDQLDHAVRWLIVLLVLVFDPLAIFMLIGVSIALARKVETAKIYKRLGRPPGSRNKPKIIMQDSNTKKGPKQKVTIHDPENNVIKVVNPPAVDLSKFSP